MKEESRRWIEAARILASDPSQVVRCPDRDDGVLLVQDVVASDPTRMERYLRCEACGAWNVMRRRAPEAKAPADDT